MNPDFKLISLEQKKPTIWVLTISRPESLNALNSHVLNEMAEAIRFIGELDYEHARALIVTGAGSKAFVAGADIKEIAELGKNAKEFATKGQSVFHELELLKIPVIAAVNGFALGGGCELALSCDYIYASENAKFGLPEVSLGLIPGFGGTVRLLKAVGPRRAKELTYTGDMITAHEALVMGLVNKVTTSDKLMDEAFVSVEKILSRAPVAVCKAKKSINESQDLNIDKALENEALLFADLFETSDVQEGTRAFIEKRKPIFKGV